MTGFSPRQGGILVVAADVGITNQTRELVRLAARSGLPHLVVYLSRVDLVADRDLVDLAEMEVRGLLCEYEYRGDDAAVIQGRPGDESTGRLLTALDAEFPRRNPEERRTPRRFVIEDVFRVQGRELLVGRVTGGPLQVGQEFEIIGGAEPVRVRIASLPVAFVPRRGPGSNDLVDVMLDEIDHPLPERGHVLAEPGTVSAWSRFEAVLYLLTPAEGGRRTPFVPGYRPQFVLNGTDMGGSLAFLDPTDPGTLGTVVEVGVHLVANQRAAVEVGQRLLVREGTVVVAVGFVTRLVE